MVRAMRARDHFEQVAGDMLDCALHHQSGDAVTRSACGSPRSALVAVMISVWIGLPFAVSTAAAQVRIVSLELVLAIDVSASVDDSEFELQITGIAEAFRQPDIIDAILQHSDGIAVALVQWGSRAESIPDPPWRMLTGRDSILRYADEIEIVQRQQVGPLTAIGQAISFSVDLIETNGFHGRQRKIDISGDGHSNFGPPVIPARRQALQAGISISGLAILTDEPSLFDYYGQQIVGGASAFVLQADSYDDFSEAMARKLLGELIIQISAPADEDQNAIVHRGPERRFRPGRTG